MMSAAQQETRGLRWLADICGMDTAELPLPMLISEQSQGGGFTRELKRYLSVWLANVDPGSAFDLRTRLFRWLPVSIVVRILAFRGYDGLLYWREGRVIGHTFFQRHDSQLRGFSVGLGRAHLRRGQATVMVLDLVAHAARSPGIARVRIGRGRSRATLRVLQVLRAHQELLPFRFGEDGWIELDA